MFSSLMIKTRLTLLVTLLSVLLVAVGVLGLAGMNASNQGLKTVYEDRTIPLMDLGKIIDKINLVRLNAVVAANASNQDVVKDAVSKTQQLDKEIEDDLDQIHGNHSHAGGKETGGCFRAAVENLSGIAQCHFERRLGRRF